MTTPPPNTVQIRQIGNSMDTENKTGKIILINSKSLTTPKSNSHFKYDYYVTQNYFAVFTPTPLQDTEAIHLKNKLNGDKVNEEDDPLINNTGKQDIFGYVE